MIKRLLSIFSFLCITFPAGAEIVSSISFNPSRMGEYTYLKVADRANLRGGLRTDSLNISSGGTVSVNADSSSRVYEIPTVTGESGSSIEMTNAAFHGNTANTYSSYSASTSSTPSGLLPNVYVKGGSQTYLSDSYINTLNAVNVLKQKVSTLKGGTLKINGNSGAAVSLYSSGSTYGFHLAGNDIPEPTSAHTNTNQTLNNCQLVWEKRKTSDSTPQEVYLLALKNCGSGGSSYTCPSGSCTPGTTKTENCTNGQRRYVCDGYPYCNWRKVSDNCSTATTYYWRSMGTTQYVYGGPCNPNGRTCEYYYTSAGLPFGRVTLGTQCTAVGYKGYTSCSEYTSNGRCFMTYNVVACYN